MSLLKDDYSLVSGFAVTPKGTPLNEMYKYIGVVLLIDKSNHTIVKAQFSVVSSLTNEILQELVEGYCVDEPFENIVSKCKRHMSIPSLGAILQAIKSAIERYRDALANR